jgi:hypothetical protein
MAGLIQDKINKSLQAAECLYHRLVLLVGQAGAGKTGILRDVADDLGAEVININLALSSELLELTAKQRALRLPGILAQIVGKAQTTVVLDNIEILFDKNLKQNPLCLLQGLSRNRSVLASFYGSTDGGRIIYAVSGMY